MLLWFIVMLFLAHVSCMYHNLVLYPAVSTVLSHFVASFCLVILFWSWLYKLWRSDAVFVRRQHPSFFLLLDNGSTNHACTKHARLTDSVDHCKEHAAVANNRTNIYGYKSSPRTSRATWLSSAAWATFQILVLNFQNPNFTLFYYDCTRLYWYFFSIQRLHL